MALNITINKVNVAASFAAGATVVTAVASGGTTPYIYSLATGGDKFAINSSTGVVTTTIAMDISNIASFSVTATDSTSGTAQTGTSEVVYPPIQAAIQNKFSKSNVIYKITKDYTLENGTLTIPSGCTLDFQGGSIVNGTIIFNNTTLSGSVKFAVGTFVSGSTTNINYDVRWFGAKGDGTTNDTAALNWCFNHLSKVYLPTGTYNITNIIIKGDKFGFNWKGDLAYPNKYRVGGGSTTDGASAILFHTGSGKMIEFTGNVGECTIEDICLVTGDNTTDGFYFAKDKQATYFKTIGVNIWANTNNKVATGVSLGNGFAVTFDNFNFRGLNVGIDIPQTTGGWFTETLLGGNYPCYIIDCNKALNICRGRDIIINNMMIEKVNKVIDLISYAESYTNVTFNNCYFEDYARGNSFAFEMTDLVSGKDYCSLILNNCTFLFNTLQENVFKSNGNLILQNNKGLNVTNTTVSGQFISLFNREFYTGDRAYYNRNPGIGLFKTDWYGYLGSSNFDITDRFAMGYPNGVIDYAQSLRINRRFKVSATEIANSVVNVPLAYIPVDTNCIGMVEIKTKMFNKNLGNAFSASSYGTTHRFQDLTTVVELNNYTVTPTINGSFDATNNITNYYATIPQISGAISDIYIDMEFYITDASIWIQPSWGIMPSIDTTKYIPNGWRFYDISDGWKRWNGTEWIAIT